MDPDLYIYPGITKNLTKTMCGKLKRFIKKQFKDKANILSDPSVQEFLSTSQYDYKVLHIKKLKGTKIGKEIADFFFGNLIWCQDLSELNKLDINYYFQFNHVWYGNEEEEEQLSKKEQSLKLEMEEKQEKIVQEKSGRLEAQGQQEKQQIDDMIQYEQIAKKVKQEQFQEYFQ